MSNIILGKYYTILDYLNIDNLTIKNLLIAALKKGYNINTPYNLNTYFILDRIKSKNIRQTVINKLVNENFDVSNPFPEELFRDYIQVVKSIENLEKEYEYYMYYIKKGKKFISVNNLNGIFLNCNPNVCKFAFRVGYEIIIQLNKNNECFIALAPSAKEKFTTLNNINKKLQKTEKDTWIIADDGLWLKTIKGKTTNIKRNELFEYVSKYNLFN